MKNFEVIMKNAENTIDTLIDEKVRRRKYMDRIHKPFKEFVEELNKKYQTPLHYRQELSCFTLNIEHV